MLREQFYSSDIDYGFLDSPKGKLYTITHNPGKSSLNTTIILINPIFEERSRSHRYLFNWGRFLAFHGYHVIRFDYYGQGDSEGDITEMSIQSQLDDIRIVHDWVKKQFSNNQIALHGLRWGAALALIYSRTHHSELDHLVCWEPIENGRTYMMSELRKNLATQMIVHSRVVEDRKALIGKLESGEAVNIDGYLVAPEFWNQIDMVDLKDNKFENRVLKYKFAKAPRAGQKDSGTSSTVDGNLTEMVSVVPQVFLEINDYSSHNAELFGNTLKWMSKRD